jgi:hypothetical protein
VVFLEKIVDRSPGHGIADNMEAAAIIKTAHILSHRMYAYFTV